MSRGVTTLTGLARLPGRHVAIDCACAWVACDAEGCEAMVTAPDRSDAGDAVELALAEGWRCDDGDRCEVHAALGVERGTAPGVV